MPLGLSRPAAEVRRDQRQPKPRFGHAVAVLATFPLKVKRPRFKLLSQRERSRKSTRKYRRFLAWKHAPQLHPKAGPGDFCQIGPAPGGGRIFSDPGRASDHQDSHRRPKSRRFFQFFLVVQNYAIRSPGAPKPEFTIYDIQNPIFFWRASKNIKSTFFLPPGVSPGKFACASPVKTWGCKNFPSGRTPPAPLEPPKTRFYPLLGDEQPKTGPRKFTFSAAGRAGLAVADRQLKPRARTIKGKPSSTGIGG